MFELLKAAYVKERRLFKEVADLREEAAQLESESLLHRVRWWVLSWLLIIGALTLGFLFILGSLVAPKADLPMRIGIAAGEAGRLIHDDCPWVEIVAGWIASIFF